MSQRHFVLCLTAAATIIVVSSGHHHNHESGDEIPHHIVKLCITKSIMELKKANEVEATQPTPHDHSQRHGVHSSSFRETFHKTHGHAMKQPTPENADNAKCGTRLFLMISVCIAEKIKEEQGVIPSEISEMLRRVRLPYEVCTMSSLSLTGCSKPSHKIPMCHIDQSYRTFNGYCNNLSDKRKHLWGSANRAYGRALPPAYDDGVNAKRSTDSEGNPLPSPRSISTNTSNEHLPDRTHLANREEDESKTFPDQKSTRQSNMVTVWGQFGDHDMFLTPEIGGALAEACCRIGTEHPILSINAACHPMDVRGDTWYTDVGMQCLRFVRSLDASDSHRCILPGHREQMNQITVFLDGSQIYGSSLETNKQVRRGETAYLKTANFGEYCPGIYENPSLGEVNDGCRYPQLPYHQNASNPFPELREEGKVEPRGQQEFFTAEVRSNENGYLAAMHTLFVRAHNGIAKMLEDKHGAGSEDPWDQEKIFQETRKIIGAIMQVVFYKEFMPVVLGQTVMNDFGLSLNQLYEYDPNLDPTAHNVFTTAAFRFGHTLVLSCLFNGSTECEGLFENLSDLQYHFLTLERYFPSRMVFGTIQRSSGKEDGFLTPALTDELPDGTDKPKGSDLLAINIQRGRDHGLPNYNAWREYCNLPTFANFEEMSTSGTFTEEAMMKLRAAYNNVYDIDVYVGGIWESLGEEGTVGPLWKCLLAKHFRKIKFGDRFWVQHLGHPGSFTKGQIAALEDINLASVICEFTFFDEIQEHVFLTVDASENPVKSCEEIQANSGFLNLVNVF